MSEFDFDEKDGNYGLAPDQRRWFFGPVGYVLRDVHALETPVPCRGWQGFWHLTSRGERERGVWSAVERDVRAQLSSAGAA
jgi:hypothetical protein